MFCTLVLQRGVNSVLALRALPLAPNARRWFSWSKALNAVPSVFLAQLVALRALCGAYLRKRIVWRGIEYEIKAPDEIHMLNYRPFGKITSDPGRSII